jgi:peroxiredoxin
MGAGAQLVAVTPEKPEAIAILESTGAPKDVIDMSVGNLPFDVLHDNGNSLAAKFGLEFELPESHKTLMKELHIDLVALTGNQRFVFPDPATYLIGSDGLIKWSFVPNNYRKRAEVDQILTALSEL